MTGGQHLLPVLGGVFGLMKLGLVITVLAGLPQYYGRQFLSRYTPVDMPDPTLYQRPWERLYNQYFDPFGVAAAERSTRLVPRQITYHLSIGVVVLALAVVTYLLTAGVLVGGTVAAYQAGLEINLIPMFDTVVAAVVLVGFAILAHAQERASQLPAR